MEVARLLNGFRKRFLSYRPLVEVLIYRKNLIHNLNLFKKSVGKNLVAPVLKSNAYGHGLVEIAKIIAPTKPPFVVVDSIFEAQTLRSANIKTPILIVGYTPLENIQENRLKNIDFTVSSLELLKKIVNQINRPLKIQLKFDTGMHRQGIDPGDLEKAVNILKTKNKITITGILSHLADAENSDSELTQYQIAAWNEIVPVAKKTFKKLTFWHLSATSGAELYKKIDSNVVRIGLGLYGYSGAKSKLSNQLKPVMEVNTIITSVKTIAAKESVGYSATFVAQKPTTLATLPMGYYEGLDRRLSNVGSVRIKNQTAKFAGNISMNISSIDVSQIPDQKIGDKVNAISADVNSPNNIANLARLAKTIPYELLVHIPAHLRRTVV